MKSELKIVIGVVMTLVVIIFLIYAGKDLGFSADFTEDFVTLLPGLIFFVVGAYVLVTQGVSSFSLAGFGILGVGVAMLASYLVDVGVLVTVNLEEIQVAVVAFCLMIGGVIFAASGRR